MKDFSFTEATVSADCSLSQLRDDARTLREELRERGYASKTIVDYGRACRRFIEWVSRARTRPRHLDEIGIQSFIRDHLTVCRCTPACPNGTTVRAALRHLRKIGERRHGQQECRTLNRFSPQLAEEIRLFEQYLQKVCGVSMATRTCRLRYVGEFLEHYFAGGEVAPSLITPLKVRDYVCRRVRHCRPGTASVIAGSIKSYLKFLVLHGKLDAHVLFAIPRLPHWRLTGCPTVLAESQVEQLLDAFDQDKASERRDRAMALCMLDLGLRAGEVAGLTLEDVDWRAATMRIQITKTRSERTLPLSDRCWDAVVRYVQHGRPDSDDRHVFLRHRVPVGGSMLAENVRGAMRRAYARAGFPKTWTGTHLLRHTAATRMQARGATLKELADVLGHQSIDTTMIYTKLDESALRAVALPWPEVE